MDLQEPPVEVRNPSKAAPAMGRRRECPASECLRPSQSTGLETQGQPCDLGGQSSPEGGAAAAAPPLSLRKRQAEDPAPPALELRTARAALSWLQRAAVAPGRAGAPGLETGKVLLRIRHAQRPESLRGPEAAPTLPSLQKPGRPREREAGAGRQAGPSRPASRMLVSKVLCDSLAVTDLAGKEWTFSTFKKTADRAIKLQGAGDFVADHQLKSGDVVAISRAPAQAILQPLEQGGGGLVIDCNTPQALAAWKMQQLEFPPGGFHARSVLLVKELTTSDVGSGSIGLPWTAMKTNLPSALRGDRLTLSDAAGADWDFGVYVCRPGGQSHVIRLTGATAFLKHHKLKPGDGISISRAWDGGLHIDCNLPEAQQLQQPVVRPRTALRPPPVQQQLRAQVQETAEPQQIGAAIVAKKLRASDAQGTVRLSIVALRANLPSAFTDDTITATDLQGKEWNFKIYYSAGDTMFGVRAKPYLEKYGLGSGDVIAIFRAPAQGGNFLIHHNTPEATAAWEVQQAVGQGGQQQEQHRSTRADPAAVADTIMEALPHESEGAVQQQARQQRQQQQQQEQQQARHRRQQARQTRQQLCEKADIGGGTESGSESDDEGNHGGCGPAASPLPAAASAPEGQGLGAAPATTAAQPPHQMFPGMALPVGQPAASKEVLALEAVVLMSKLDLAELQLAVAQEAAADLSGQASEEEQVMARLEVERRETDVQTAGLKLGTAQRRLARAQPQA